ncbi:unnamed protein product [Linum trigynum]|uniref:Uncharacterized protein n=1 Tax=Linum trigynum TaxID=586398 RepID=A0AAV2CU40_9ROSI
MPLFNSSITASFEKPLAFASFCRHFVAILVMLFLFFLYLAKDQGNEESDDENDSNSDSMSIESEDDSDDDGETLTDSTLDRDSNSPAGQASKPFSV